MRNFFAFEYLVNYSVLIQKRLLSIVTKERLYLVEMESEDQSDCDFSENTSIFGKMKNWRTQQRNKSV